MPLDDGSPLEKHEQVVLVSSYDDRDIDQVTRLSCDNSVHSLTGLISCPKRRVGVSLDDSLIEKALATTPVGRLALSTSQGALESNSRKFLTLSS